MKGRIGYSHFLTKSEETHMSAPLQEARYENTSAVYMALELSNTQWKVLVGNGHHHRHKTGVAGAIAGLLEQEMGADKHHLLRVTRRPIW